MHVHNPYEHILRMRVQIVQMKFSVRRWLTFMKDNVSSVSAVLRPDGFML